MPNSSYASSQYSAKSKGTAILTSSRGARVPRPRKLGTVTPVKRLKEKFSMKNWLRNKLRNFIFSDSEAEAKVATVEEASGFRDDHSLRFDVTSARGGVILILN